MSRPASAWIFAEHRTIGEEGWRKLSPEARAYYSELWRSARPAVGERMCRGPQDAAVDSKATCLDYSEWPALAADHSCSPSDLLGDVLPSGWALDVARVSAEVKSQLEAARTPHARDNAWVMSNLQLQSVDDEYVTRAGANNAHFLLSRVAPELDAFARASGKAGAPLNALGLYQQYHLAALALARATRTDRSPAPERAAQILALEAYALHFLQDIYSSGHVAGTWGDAATRKGTHDYYSVNGLADTTWDGRHITLHGDAHMLPEDLARASQAVAMSMDQVFGVAGHSRGDDAIAAVDAAGAIALSSCQETVQPTPIAADADVRARMLALLQHTPMPGYGPDSVAWPRQRAEFGPFIGISSIGGAALSFGGYGGVGTRTVGQLSLTARLGYGLEEVVGSVNTGTMFVELGVVTQTAQTETCPNIEQCFLTYGTSLLPRVPARGGLTMAVRLPFWLLPGDLLVLAPVLAVASRPTLTKVAMRAASGGVIPWQRTFSTRIGSFEAVIGRSVEMSMFGVVGGATLGWAPWANSPAGPLAIFPVSFRSLTFAFPALEYTPFRAISQSLSSALRVRFGYAIDVPFDDQYLNAGGVGPAYAPSHMLLLQLGVEARHYL